MFSYIYFKVNEASNITPGRYTIQRSLQLAKKRLRERQNTSTRKFKKQRLHLKQRAANREISAEVKEGDTYKTELELAADTPDIFEIPDQSKLNLHKPSVIFDLETTGLSRQSDIIQLAAISDSVSFNKYIHPRKTITTEASNITKLTVVEGELCYNGNVVEAVEINVALLDFIDYLKQFEQPIIVGHNILAFDIPVLYNRLKEFGLASEFSNQISGCVDTLRLAKRKYPKNVVQNYRQETLVKCLLRKTYDAHSALEDVKTLQELYVDHLQDTCTKDDVFSFAFHQLKASLRPLVLKKAISLNVCIKLAQCGIGLQQIKLAYARNANSGVKIILEQVLKHQRNTPGIINKINNYLQELEPKNVV